ncbi:MULTISPECIES: ABC transporter ATP-binding protein [Cryobacterium]|uniref:ABC transporter ATP-binding protein n=1 Tax=Cryobacterium breve TaxID=1259258 RepID=A0ABY2J787_9MICO|nr:MULTISPECIES: ABC transporter ATP-binding protein [Cryobacterium]TFC95744.1 ABC transporter ATP-binding protein [Cryobacterium sp. TmT3-12]TFD00183.1 ABC transporter ATP-binding protein [Cryobacterium breve]
MSDETDVGVPGAASVTGAGEGPGGVAAGVAPAVRVRNLVVGFGPKDGADPVLNGVSFEVAPGECLAIVGESGSGKSVTARSLLGLAGDNAWVRADELSLAGSDVQNLSEAQWRRRRGRDVGLVVQDALVSLDPLRPVGREIADSLRLHTRLDAAARHTRVLEALERVGLPDAGNAMRKRSGELSGGQRQRALIAAAIALDPPLLIADEPTTALDVTVQAQILDLLATLKRAGTGILLISHDLAVVGRIADRIAVLCDGRIVEQGPADEVLTRPRHPVTRTMIAAIPVDKPRGLRLNPRAAEPVLPSLSYQSGVAPGSSPDDCDRDTSPTTVLEAIGLVKRFTRPDGSEQLAVDSVSFRLERGTTLGIVGESGSGKTTSARLALALTRPDAGEVRVLGQAFSAVPEKERRALRPHLGAVYQDALSSFDPRLSVEQVLRDAVAGGARRTGRVGASAGAADRLRVLGLLEAVGLPQGLLGRRPLSLSGGQRQRVSIARALASGPQILICDEPVSSLDVTVQAQVLDLLDELQRNLGLSLLFISHDLGVIQHVSDQVAVMLDGRIVETGATARVFAAPEHPYTQALLGAVPRIGF